MGKEMILRLFLEPDGLPRGFLGGGDREGDPLGTDLLHHVVVVDGGSIERWSQCVFPKRMLILSQRRRSFGIGILQQNCLSL